MHNWTADGCVDLDCSYASSDHALGAACCMVQRHEFWSSSFASGVIRPYLTTLNGPII